jgi:hypothetical protein
LQVVTKDASSHVGDQGMAESMAKELADWFAPPPDDDEAEE